MPDIIDYNSDKTKFRGAIQFLCEAIGVNKEVMKSLRPEKPIVVQLTVNGHEIPFLETVQKFVEWNDKETENVAAAMLQERAKELVEKFSEMTKMIDRVSKDAILQIFPNARTED